MADETCQRCSQLTDYKNLCTKCLREIYKQLTSLAVLVVQLQVTVTRQAKTGVQQPGGGNGEKPLMFDDNASEIAHAVQVYADYWFLRSGGPRGDLSTFQRVLWLREKRAQLAQDQLIGECVHQLENLLSLAWDAVDHKPVRIYLGRCECGWEMFEYADAGVYECRCGKRHMVDTRRHENLRNAQILMVTAEQAILYLGDVFGIRIKITRIRNWGSRGQVHRVRDPVSGDYMYRLGEILEMLRGTQSHAAKIGDTELR